MVVWHGTKKLYESQKGGDREKLSTDLERKKQYMKDCKEDEDKIREMKKSLDFRKWASLYDDINMKFLELADIEDKLMRDYNIKIYTKYGLFRSRRYDNIC